MGVLIERIADIIRNISQLMAFGLLFFRKQQQLKLKEDSCY